jgi:hypothetical protein
VVVVLVDIPIKTLLKSSLVNPTRHLDVARVQHYATMLDELPPVTVFRLEDEPDGFWQTAITGSLSPREPVAQLCEQRYGSAPKPTLCASQSISSSANEVFRKTRHVRQSVGLVRPRTRYNAR